MNPRLPWYVPLMFFMTGAYLLIEVPFSVHLAGVLGGDPSTSDIDRIEHFGRMLSGMAAAIAVLGIWHFPRMERIHASRMRACVTGVVFAGMAATATFLSLGWYADIRAYVSDGQERRGAVIAMLAKRSIASSDILDSLGLDKAQQNGLVAVMPELLGHANIVRFSGRASAELAQIAGDDARATLGTVSAAKAAFFRNEFSTARRAYEAYTDSLAEAKAAHADIDETANDAWRRYSAEMDRAYPRGWPTGRGWSWAMAWRKVRFGSDIPVPESWNLRDKSVFVAAVKSKISGEIASRYQKAVEGQLGKGAHLKPGLTYEQFLAVPEVQKMVRDGMTEGVVPRGLVISPAMSDEAFEKAFYAPQVTKAVGSMREAISADPADYERGSLADMGKDAVKASILPALALMMSLLGAIVHVYKLTGYGMQIVSHLLRIRPLQIGAIRHAAVLATLSVVIFNVYGFTPAVLASPALDRISASGTYPSVLTATVLVQPHLASLGEQLSRTGVWDLVSTGLPEPRPASAASAPSMRVASLSVPVPLPRPVD